MRSCKLAWVVALDFRLREVAGCWPWALVWLRLEGEPGTAFGVP